MVENGENMILKEGRLARALAHIQRPGAWRRVDVVEKNTMTEARELSRSIQPHLHH